MTLWTSIRVVHGLILLRDISSPDLGFPRFFIIPSTQLPGDYLDSCLQNPINPILPDLLSCRLWENEGRRVEGPEAT
jgi:hypothetical protein